MNLTNQSKDLIKFFSNDSCSFPTPNEERVNPMFMQLYNDIKNGVQYVSKMKKNAGTSKIYYLAQKRKFVELWTFLSRRFSTTSKNRIAPSKWTLKKN